jgi:hypothetical protein
MNDVNVQCYREVTNLYFHFFDSILMLVIGICYKEVKMITSIYMVRHAESPFILDKKKKEDFLKRV